MVGAAEGEQCTLSFVSAGAEKQGVQPGAGHAGVCETDAGQADVDRAARGGPVHTQDSGWSRDDAGNVSIPIYGASNLSIPRHDAGNGSITSKRPFGTTNE